MVAFLAFQGIASAKEIIGEVIALDDANSKISVSYTTPEGTEAQAEIAVKPETVYVGIASFVELEAGTKVSIDATEDPATGTWSAVSVAVPEKSEEVPALDELAKPAGEEPVELVQ